MNIITGEELSLESIGIERNFNFTENQYKVFNFDHTIAAGDCRFKDAKIYFRKDGKGSINGEVWTEVTQFGDVLHIKFYVYAENGEELFTSRTYDIPEEGSMRAHDPQIVYIKFEYPKELYERINKLKMVLRG
jgi:hypothetical protein